MPTNSRDEIRRLLKEFGVGADEAAIRHLAQHPDLSEISVRLLLVDETGYTDPHPDRLTFEVRGTIHRDSE